MVWEWFPCANPLCPPTPFRNIWKKGSWVTLSLQLVGWSGKVQIHCQTSSRWSGVCQQGHAAAMLRDPQLHVLQQLEPRKDRIPTMTSHSFSHGLGATSSSESRDKHSSLWSTPGANGPRRLFLPQTAHSAWDRGLGRVCKLGLQEICTCPLWDNEVGTLKVWSLQGHVLLCSMLCPICYKRTRYK